MKRENFKQFVETDLFIDASTNKPVVLNTRRYNHLGNPLCIEEGCNHTAHNQGKDHGGFQLRCKHHLGRLGKKSYKSHKLVVPYCENIDSRLGFICTTTIVDSCMLGVDHINENHKDPRAENLQTLCAGCHAYKTKHFRGLGEDAILQRLQENIQVYIDSKGK
jgi:hypothetical protein